MATGSVTFGVVTRRFVLTGVVPKRIVAFGLGKVSAVATATGAFATSTLVGKTTAGLSIAAVFTGSGVFSGAEPAGPTTPVSPSAPLGPAAADLPWARIQSVIASRSSAEGPRFGDRLISSGCGPKAWLLAGVVAVFDTPGLVSVFGASVFGASVFGASVFGASAPAASSPAPDRIQSIRAFLSSSLIDAPVAGDDPVSSAPQLPMVLLCASVTPSSGVRSPARSRIWSKRLAPGVVPPDQSKRIGAPDKQLWEPGIIVWFQAPRPRPTPTGPLPASQLSPDSIESQLS